MDEVREWVRIVTSGLQRELDDLEQIDIESTKDSRLILATKIEVLKQLQEEVLDNDNEKS